MSENQTTHRVTIWAIRILALAAAVVSAYLAWTSWNAAPVVGCGGESVFACDEILAGKWAHWFGLPVSLFGTGVYWLLFATSWFVPRGAGERHIRLVWTVLITLALLAAGAAVWFVGLQVVLGKYCMFCCTVHACGIALCTTLLLSRPWQQSHESFHLGSLYGFQTGAAPEASETSAGLMPGHWCAVASVVVVGLIVLVLGQVLGTHETFIAELDKKLSQSNSPSSVQPPEIEQPVSTTPSSSNSPSAATTTESPSENPASNTTTGQNSDPKDKELENAVSEFKRLFGEESAERTGSHGSTPSDEPAHPRTSSGNHVRVVQIDTLGQAAPIDQLIVLGSPRAKHLVIELFDYTCHHCRLLHPTLHRFRERYGDQVAVIVRPVALYPDCNPYVKNARDSYKNACEYAKLAMAVWYVDRSKFPEYHDWLMGSEKLPSVQNAKQQALQLAGSEVLTRYYSSSEVREMLERNNLSAHLMEKGVPVLMTSFGTFYGAPKSKEVLFKLFEKHLGVRPVDGSAPALPEP